MKKLISVLLAAMMMIVPMFAMAEASTTTTDAAATEAPAADAAADATATEAAPVVVGQTEGGVDIYDLTAEVTFEGAPIEFTDDNFTISVPTTWAELEVPEDMSAVGYYAYYGLEDATQYMAVQAVAAAEGVTPSVDDMIAVLTADTNNTEIQPVMFGENTFVTYTNLTANQLGCMCIDAAGTGYLNFVFGANDNADVNALAPQIMSSIAAITADEATEATDTAADATATEAAATEAPATNG